MMSEMGKTEHQGNVIVNWNTEKFLPIVICVLSINFDGPINFYGVFLRANQILACLIFGQSDFVMITAEKTRERLCSSEKE